MEAYSINHFVSNFLYEDLQEIASRKVWNNITHCSFLITGGAGFIAYHLALCILLRNDLSHNQNQLILLVRSEQKARERYGCLLDRPDVHLLLQDVCTEIDTGKYDYIIHAAGGAEAKTFEERPVDVFNTNTLGTNQILSLAYRSKTKSLVYVSSFTVYGKQADNGGTIDENAKGLLDWTSYKGCYANGKRAGEMLCNCYLHQYQLPVKIVRPGFIYGASSWSDSRVYAEIIQKAAKGEDIVLKSAGLLYRSMCYATDLVRGIFSVLFSGENGTAYNVATEYLSIRDFASNAVQAFADRKIHLTYQNSADADVEGPKILCEKMNCSQLTQLSAPWAPRVSCAEGIRMAGEILLNNY